MEIGKRLRQIRMAKGLSQHDIEARSGLCVSWISRVERGYAIPTLPTLERWAKALDLQPYEVLQPDPRVAFEHSAKASVPPSARAGEVVSLFDQLSADDQELLLYIARKLAEEGNSSDKP